jgi:hypothetical protein
MELHKNASTTRWQKLFLFCAGISVAAAFCMKWMESDLLFQGEKFSVIGLELGYAKEKISAVLSGLDPAVERILRYHLSFDFIFMVGVFPGIAALCMMARAKTQTNMLRRILLGLALLQLVAWGLDIIENCYLFKWLDHPVAGTDYSIFRMVVILKWGIAIIGIIGGALSFTRKKFR